MTEATLATRRNRKSTAPQRARRSWWMRGALAIGLIAVVAVALALIPDRNSGPSLGAAVTHTISRGELLVTVTEQGTLESSNNTEIKCRVRGDSNTIIWVIESGTEVKPGDDLLRLETLLIEEEISERTKFAHLARAEAARSEADVARAELAIKEYLEGRFVSELSMLQKDLAVAEAGLLSAKNMRDYAKMMAESDYASELEVEEKEFAVTQADLGVQLIKTQIDVLNRFTKEEELATLWGAFNAARAKHEADKERAYADEQRLERALEELEYCVVKAERSGMVIYPRGEEWEEAPEIEEGATVHKDQVMLLMPDLTNMQVKVGIHESVIDRVHAGLPAKITLPGKTLDGNIRSVATVAKPAGWWTGNVVKYESIVQLPTEAGLKPGMSVEVQVVLAEHQDVLMIPTSAVVETRQGRACWVKKGQQLERRTLQLGDHNDMFIVVTSGVVEGEEVVLDPLAHVAEAQAEAAKTIEKT